jgi:hypothetical protein
MSVCDPSCEDRVATGLYQVCYRLSKCCRHTALVEAGWSRLCPLLGRRRRAVIHLTIRTRARSESVGAARIAAGPWTCRRVAVPACVLKSRAGVKFVPTSRCAATIIGERRPGKSIMACRIIAVHGITVDVLVPVPTLRRFGLSATRIRVWGREPATCIGVVAVVFKGWLLNGLRSGLYRDPRLRFGM